MVGLSESLWHEAQLTGSNVGVSVLCPAFVRTGIARSDRNQPAGMGGWVTAGSQVAAKSAEFLTAGVDGGIEPASAADAVVEGIRAGRLWIFTHPESPQFILDRARAIVDEGVPPSVRRLGQ